MGDDRTAALFSGPELLGGEGLGAFVRRIGPDVVAGHGFGDLAALVAADALDLRAAIALARLREQLVADANDDVEGGLLAVLDVEAAARTICSRSGVRVARYDSPARFVVAGTSAQLRKARRAAHALDIRVADVPAPGALHSPAMARAARHFARAVTEVGFRPPALTVLSAVTAAPLLDPHAELARCLEAPVLWTQTVRALSAAGATRYVEANSDHALGDLVLETLYGAAAGTGAAELVVNAV